MQVGWSGVQVAGSNTTVALEPAARTLIQPNRT